MKVEQTYTLTNIHIYNVISKMAISLTKVNLSEEKRIGRYVNFIVKLCFNENIFMKIFFLD